MLFKKKKSNDKFIDLQSSQHTSKEDQKVYEPEFSWESTRIALVESSERKAWNVAKALGVGLVLSLATMAMMMPLKTVEPFVIEVDKNTGMSELLQIANVREIPTTEMMNKYWLSQYVLSRESYDWRTLNQEFVKVRELSLPNVFDVYASQYGTENKNSLEMRLKDDKRIRVRLNTIVINSDSIATVRFSKELINNDSGTVEATNHWTATIGFEYFPDFEVKEERRIINPFGFKVTSYRVDPEMTGGK